jgi:hypothetical protein
MNVIEKNEGEKLPYEVTGNKLTIDDAITLRLDRYEQDYPVHIDVVQEENGNLLTSIGTGTDGKAYAAEIDIPARQYTETTTGDDPETEEVEPETVTRVPIPFDIDACTLTLWAVK